MNNDYYLEQINNKLNTTNQTLEDIIENQEITINKLQNIIISGEQYYNNINNQINTNNNAGYLLCFIIALYLCYNFCVRCLK